MSSYSARRAGARNGARLSEQAIREALARTAAQEALRQDRLKQARDAARAAEKARPKLTAEDVRGAVVVRDCFGWHRVVRVSAKSVTVATPYSWTDRIPLDRVLEARS